MLGEHVVNFCVPIVDLLLYHTIRAGRRGGGVTVLCSDELRPRKMSDLCTADDTIESCIIEMVLIFHSSLWPYIDLTLTQL